MNEREPEESSKALQGIFWVNLGLVLVFSVFLGRQWLSPLPEPDWERNPASLKATTGTEVRPNPAAPEREPQSSPLASQSQSKLQSHSKSQSLSQPHWLGSIELGCPSPSDSVRETQAKRIRLWGPDCSLGLDSAQKTFLINESNGHQGTLFRLDQAHRFTTDYIDLVEGENRIRISQWNGDGQRLESHLIIRRLASP